MLLLCVFLPPFRAVHYSGVKYFFTSSCRVGVCDVAVGAVSVRVSSNHHI